MDSNNDKGQFRDSQVLHDLDQHTIHQIDYAIRFKSEKRGMGHKRSRFVLRPSRTGSRTMPRQGKITLPRTADLPTLFKEA
jgi:hypothetical protein